MKLIRALRRWLRGAPLSEPFEPYARALNDHWIRRRPVSLYLRGTHGSFHRQRSTQGFEPRRRRRELERIALALCRGRVLNVGAGAGRHSLLLREAGLEVVSIDIEPTLVDLMKCRGLDRVYQADVFVFDRGEFDTILFLEETIGLAGALKRLPELLVRLKQQLNHGGQILLDSSCPRVAYGSMQYAGEHEFQLRYRSVLGRRFPWLQVDFSVLSVCAAAAGYDTELLVCVGAGPDYLARLTLKT